MEQEERETILKAINLFKKNKIEFQKIWLILAIEEGIPLHQFMDFRAFIKSYFDCSNSEAKELIKSIEVEFKSISKKDSKP